MAREYRRLLLVFGALLALLAATMVVSTLGLGPLGAALSLGIATLKAVLIFWFFMQLREQGGLARLFAAAAVFWIALLLAFGSADLVTRTPIDGAHGFDVPAQEIDGFAADP